METPQSIEKRDSTRGFLCVFDAWEDLVRDPLGGSMMAGVGAGWSGSLGSPEGEGSSVRSVESSTRSMLRIVLSISVPVHGWAFLSYLTLRVGAVEGGGKE